MRAAVLALMVVVVAFLLSGFWGGAVRDFPVTAHLDPPFVPGATRPVNLVITNPHRFPMHVTGVVITVSPTTSQAGCDGRSDLLVVRGLGEPVDVPARSTRSLEELGIPLDSWPMLVMPNLPTNQDACQTAVFRISYRGEAARG